MEQKRPADIIQELLDYLWNGLGLEEKGWKRLKKGDFKKKMKNGLTYQIWFDRSRYNYIDYEIGHVYSHIIDEDRCINAQRLEEAFYSSKTPDPVEDTEPKTADTAVTESDESDAAKILELLKNPETAALLKQLAKAL